MQQPARWSVVVATAAAADVEDTVGRAELRAVDEDVDEGLEHLVVADLLVDPVADFAAVGSNARLARGWACSSVPPGADVSVGIGDGADADVVDHVSELGAVGLVGMAGRRGAESIGEQGDDALQQEQAVAPQQSLYVVGSVSGRQRLPHVFDDALALRLRD